METVAPLVLSATIVNARPAIAVRLPPPCTSVRAILVPGTLDVLP